MLDELKSGKKAVGVKETQKAIRDGRVRGLFIADDADERLVRPLVALCEQAGIPVKRVGTMRELGSLCGIDVGAAAAGLL